MFAPDTVGGMLTACEQADYSPMCFPDLGTRSICSMRMGIQGTARMSPC